MLTNGLGQEVAMKLWIVAGKGWVTMCLFEIRSADVARSQNAFLVGIALSAAAITQRGHQAKARRHEHV